MTCGTCDDLSTLNRRDVSQRAERYRGQNADFATLSFGGALRADAAKLAVLLGFLLSSVAGTLALLLRRRTAG